MKNVEYNRNINLDKVTTLNVDKLLHSKIKQQEKLRIPSK